MKLSTKSKYALLFLVELAEHGKKSLSELALSNQISVSYLEQLAVPLVKNNIIKGRRGPKGGYELGQIPESIKVTDVVRAVEKQKESSPSWQGISNKLVEKLEPVTLFDLMQKDQ